MTDLAAMSDEDLMRLKVGTPGAQPATPAVDLSKLSNEELMRLKVGTPKEKQSLLSKYYTPMEMGLSLATGAVGNIVGAVGGLAHGLMGGRYGTPEGARAADAKRAEIADALTYKPRGEAAQEGMSSLASLMHESKLAGLGPTEAVAMAGVPLRSIAAQVEPAVRSGAEAIANRIPRRGEASGVIGGGAAMSDAEQMRRNRAAQLPVPIDLTKGEASRDFAQQKFEKETSKHSITGAPLREHGADNVEKLIQNFETWARDTGAEAPDLISVGKAVDAPLVKRMEAAKLEIRNAYDKAEAAGHMSDKVSTAPLLKYLEENHSAAGEAGVLNAAEKELIRLGGGLKEGTLSKADRELGRQQGVDIPPASVILPSELKINELEKVRRLAGRLGKTGSVNSVYASEINKVIDGMTEGVGGDLYKQARSLYSNYAKEFKNQGAVRKLVSVKPGTTDRSVALEDVFRHSVLDGSNQDLQNIFRSLEKAGPDGLQAINELKGQTINHMLESMTKNAQRDIRGNPVPSAAGLDKVVRALDADGKLEFMFGKKGAEQIRDIRDLTFDLHTSPPGSVNHSNTAAALRDGLGALAVGRIPTATARLIAAAKSAMDERKLAQQVEASLRQP